MTELSRSPAAMLNGPLPALGAFVFSTDPAIPQIYAEAGFDFVVVDLEHALNDLRSAMQHLQACRAAGIHAFARIGGADLANVPRLLDAGFKGMMLPHLGIAAAGTDTAVQALRYPPDGLRPTCTGVPAAGFGLSNFARYAEASNRDVVSIGLVEDGEAVERIDQILDRKGADWIMPGPGDLASSLGVHGQLKHPTVEAAVDKVLDAAAARGIPAGMYINDPSEAAPWIARGVKFLVLSIDYKWLGKTLKAAAEACRPAA